MKTNHLVSSLAIFLLFAGPNGYGSASGSDRPNGLTATDWSGIRAAHDQSLRAIRAGDDELHFARHPVQGWTTEFDGRGFTVRPDQGDWSWGLELSAYGAADGDPVPIEGTSKASFDADRLVYPWNEDIAEWFVNGPQGLLEGWTLFRAPQGNDHSRLRLEFAVRGKLHPKVDDSGTSVRFLKDSGEAALTFSALDAWDRDGKPLPVRFDTSSDSLAIELDASNARFPVTIDPIVQSAYVKASNPGYYDYFGGSVAVSGDTVVVGAYGEDSSATGVDGDQTDDYLYYSGAAYVFVRTGTQWSQQAYLKASNPDYYDYFGWSVSISGDTIVVGAPYEDSAARRIDGPQGDNTKESAGAAYVFVRDGNQWSQEAYLKASNTQAYDNFGLSVSVSGDTIVVGAPYSVDGTGIAYVFVRDGATWSQHTLLGASNDDEYDNFGNSVAVSDDTIVVGATNESSAATGVDGDQFDDSAYGAGAAYVFVREGTDWNQQAYLKASNTDLYDYFGQSVAISGDTIVVSAIYEDSAATGVDGDQADNSAYESGAAYVFVRDENQWSQQAYLKASNTNSSDFFGQSVATSGDTVIVGASNESSSATGVNGNQTNDVLYGSGAAYVFDRDEAQWSQLAYLKASNTDWYDNFGWSVAISDRTVVVGAQNESSAATGIDGNEADNSIYAAGAAYLFRFPIYGIRCNQVKGKRQTAFYFTNTGDSTETFKLAYSERVNVHGQGRRRKKPPGLGLPPFSTVLLRDGVDITGFAKLGLATITLDPGESTQVVVSLRRRKAFALDRAVFVWLGARNVDEPSVVAYGKTVFKLQAPDRN